MLTRMGQMLLIMTMTEAELNELMEIAGEFAKFAVVNFQGPLAKKAINVSLAIADFIDAASLKERPAKTQCKDMKCM